MLVVSSSLMGCALPGLQDDWDRTVTPPSDRVAAAERAHCEYRRGALAAETQGASHPYGDKIPVDHIVIVMQENRSFDHYFQKLPEHGQPEVEVAPVDFTNPGVDGNPVPIHRSKLPCIADTAHSWAAVDRQIADGRMDGFVLTSEGYSEGMTPAELLMGDRSMEYLDEPDMPFYYGLARDFAIADHYHASVPGPTWPNRLYLYASSSFGRAGNSAVVPPKTMFDELDRRGVDYRVYFSDRVRIGAFIEKLVPPEHTRDITAYFDDAARGDLPAVAFVCSTFGAANDVATWEHPPALPQIGERWVATVIDALGKSPDWNRSALFLAYDEHGGLFDHVPPPPACAPDEFPPESGVGSFERLGVRVPMILVSPYARRHFVGHHVYDHTSIARFVQARFRLPALSARDANAEAPWEMFDFESPPGPPPVVVLPEVDPALAKKCKETHMQ
jgi:phospholipase C